jgi:hypothetical protein
MYEGLADPNNEENLGAVLRGCMRFWWGKWVPV